MPRVAPSIRVTGAKESITKAGNIRPAALKSMRAAATERGKEAVARFQREMLAEYQSPWATGSIARSLKVVVKNEADGVSVSFSAQSGARNHIDYITGILPSSYFREFPVRPFVIKPVYAKLLKIRQSGQVRKFIQDPTTGRMQGATGGPILKAQVLWGSGSGGFQRDVIADVTQSEGASFVADMEAAVANAISETTR